jgi:ornithine carbamoyltransferase
VIPPRHFLDLSAVGARDLRGMLDDARAVKAAREGLPRGAPDPERPLEGRILAMIFEKPSTRTRVSFDVGMRQLGGETLLLSASEMQLGRGESIADTARVLSRYVDAIMIRTTAHRNLLELAEHATVPVINGLTDDSHPCQLMADVMTLEEHRGPLAGRKVAWIGDGNNMCSSFMEAAARFGFELAIACPEPLDPDPARRAWAEEAGARISIHREPRGAVSGADAVVTDTWLSMGDEGEARERRHNLLRPYQVDEAMMEAAGDAIFMHCLPAHPGEEATGEVMYGPRSVIFDEAENRLHAQKGVLRWCLGAA